jgi:ribonuclease P protein component
VKLETLKKNGDFRRAYARGKSFADAMLVVYVLKNRVGSCRCGVTTSKKIGCAVERNRCRRIISEALRTLDEPLRSGWDLVFVARGKTKFVTMPRLREVMRRQLREAGVLAGSTGAGFAPDRSAKHSAAPQVPDRSAKR